MTIESRRKSISDEYASVHPESRRLFEAQRAVMPGGVTHSARVFEPFPLFIRAVWGSRKRDVDGLEYVDYWMGHGANLLGHGHPVVMEAIALQMARGPHAGGENELALEWAQLVCELVPSAERVRFCATGGEATQLAIRIARAFTGRDKLVKFQYHFHGWHDSVAFGVSPPFEADWSSGIPAAVAEQTLVVPFNDIDAVREALDRDAGVAAVILEPAGGYNDTVPVNPRFLADLRALTREREVVLIFDEVVTGFRYAIGGAQQHFGITPDLTALGKIVSGGLPGGAVVGRAELMATLAPRSPSEPARPYIPHFGTWNAAPIMAAAGLAALRTLAAADLPGEARQRADQLRVGIDDTFTKLGIAGFAYGRSSIWKTCLGEPPKMLREDYSEVQADSERLYAGWGALAPTFRQAMLLEGVDMMRTGGFMSAVHTDEDVEDTVRAFERSLRRLGSAGLL